MPGRGINNIWRSYFADCKHGFWLNLLHHDGLRMFERCLASTDLDSPAITAFLAMVMRPSHPCACIEYRFSLGTSKCLLGVRRSNVLSPESTANAIHL